MADFQPVGVTATVRGFSTFIAQMGRIDSSIRASGVAGTAAAVGMGALKVAIGAVVVAATAAIAAITAIIGALTALGVSALKTAISVEDAFAGVLKTTQGLGTNLYDLTEAGKRVFAEFRNLATQIPLTFEALADIGQLGGQLGIPEDQISRFTKTVAAIGYSTNLSYEEAALGLARLSSVFKISTEDIADNVERQASAIVYLGNNYAVTEQEILLSSRNIAGAAAIVGLSQADIFGIAAAFNIAGVRAEAGGTAVQNALISIDQIVKDTAKGIPTALDSLVKNIGMTAEEFVTMWEEDAGQAFVKFVQATEASGDDIVEQLGNFDISSQRALRTFLGMANASDVLTNALHDSNIAFEQNTALTREASIRYATIKSQLQILKNTIRDVVLEIGLQLAPGLQTILDIDFKTWGEAIKNEIPGAFSAIGAAISNAWENDIKPSVENLTGISLPEINLGQITSADIQTTIKNITTSIERAIEKAGDFSTKLSELKTTIQEDAIAAFQEMSRVLNEEVLPAIQPVIDGLNLVWFVVSGDFPLIQEQTNEVGNVLQQQFGENIPQVLGNLGTSLDSLATFWAIWGSTIITLAGASTIGVGIAFQLGGVLWTSIITNAWNTILGIFSAFGLLLQGETELAWQTLVQTISNTGTEMSNTVLFIIDQILSIFGTSLPEMGTLWVEGMTIIIDEIKKFGTRAIETFNQILTDVKNAILNSGWYQIGVSIVNGIIAGIKDTGSALIDAIDGLIGGGSGPGQAVGGGGRGGKGIVDHAAKSLAINTPSKVFMAMGKSVVEGLAMGIAESGMAKTATQSMVGGIVSMASSAMPTSAVSGNSTDRSFNPTINANYYKTQSPQDIAGDLALISAVRG